MTIILYLLIIYLVVLSLITFLVWGLDKFYARTRHWRISEHHLLNLALLGGASGALLAMLLLRHKTRKPRMWAGVLSGCALHLAVLAYFYFMV
jgi:uncharacterized membrane protein YsdA (DUF1294 family)